MLSSSCQEVNHLSGTASGEDHSNSFHRPDSACKKFLSFFFSSCSSQHCPFCIWSPVHILSDWIRYFLLPSASSTAEGTLCLPDSLACPNWFYANARHLIHISYLKFTEFVRMIHRKSMREWAEHEAQQQPRILLIHSSLAMPLSTQ